MAGISLTDNGDSSIGSAPVVTSADAPDEETSVIIGPPTAHVRLTVAVEDRYETLNCWGCSFPEPKTPPKNPPKNPLASSPIAVSAASAYAALIASSIEAK